MFSEIGNVALAEGDDKNYMSFLNKVMKYIRLNAMKSETSTCI